MIDMGSLPVPAPTGNGAQPQAAPDDGSAAFAEMLARSLGDHLTGRYAKLVGRQPRQVPVERLGELADARRSGEALPVIHLAVPETDAGPEGGPHAQAVPQVPATDVPAQTVATAGGSAPEAAVEDQPLVLLMSPQPARPVRSTPGPGPAGPRPRLLGQAPGAAQSQARAATPAAPAPAAHAATPQAPMPAAATAPAPLGTRGPVSPSAALQQPHSAPVDRPAVDGAAPRLHGVAGERRALHAEPVRPGRPSVAAPGPAAAATAAVEMPMAPAETSRGPVTVEQTVGPHGRLSRLHASLAAIRQRQAMAEAGTATPQQASTGRPGPAVDQAPPTPAAHHAAAPTSEAAVAARPEATRPARTAPRAEAPAPVPPTAVHTASAAAAESAATPAPIQAQDAPAAPRIGMGSLVDRVIRVVELLGELPPPRTMAVEIPELDGLRLMVSLRGDSVHLGVTDPDSASVLRTWRNELGAAFAERGLDLSLGGDGARDRQGRPDQAEHPHRDPDATGRRRRRPADRFSDGLRL